MQIHPLVRWCPSFGTYFYRNTHVTNRPTLQWRHNEHNGASNNRRLDGLRNRFFRRRSKKASKLRVTGLCERNSPVTGDFPTQRASNAKNASIWWRHHKLYHSKRIFLSMTIAVIRPMACWSITFTCSRKKILVSKCIARSIVTSSPERKQRLFYVHYDDVIKWKHFPRYWPFVLGIHRSPVNSPHKGQWRGALMFSLISAWINGWLYEWWGWWSETPTRSLWRQCNVCYLFSLSYS